ncbi:complement receptor type 2-like isoform X2 [Clavelina lepadiformis]|uniref:complement receptor type 2-like isoform X2 n=1 Tax=Clavelina lepadiformis TaxID=159417 RepID=UPI0040418033
MHWKRAFAALSCFLVGQMITFVNCCTQPRTYEETSYSPKANSYRPGQSIRYSCSPGHFMFGSQRSFCLSTNSWSSPSPICLPHSQRRGCDEPKDPENGYFSYYSTTNGLVAVGDYITYGCNPNYLLHGAARVYCYSAGWSHQPSCAKKSLSFPAMGVCIRPKEPLHGSLWSSPSGQTRFHEGDHIVYACLKGYRLSAESRVLCTNNGWSHTPQCAAVSVSTETTRVQPTQRPQIITKQKTTKKPPSCPHRNPPENGRYINTPKNRYWGLRSKAEFTCNDGFRLVGRAKSRCGRDGSWKQEVPHCRRYCKRPSNPDNGYVDSTPASKSYFYNNEEVTYHCNDGYRLVGNARVTCTDNGEFSVAPKCRRILRTPIRPYPFQESALHASRITPCKRLPPPSHGFYLEDSDKKIWYPGDVAEFGCEPGYILANSATFQCNNVGGWNYGTPKCQLAQRTTTRPYRPRRDPTSQPQYSCPRRDPPRFGFYSQGSYKGTPRAGDNVTFGCEPNYILVGKATSRCEGRGWNYEVPKCERGCGHPPHISYGAFHASSTSNGKFASGDVLIYRCNEGYALQGNSQVYCRDGSWTVAPTCRRYCPHRPLSENVIYTQQSDKAVWFPGEVARYGCRSGYFLFGDDNASCRDNGLWSNYLPTCEHGCRRPARPPHGIIESQPHAKDIFKVGEYVTYICDDWFHIDGDAKVYCRYDGWSHEPICRHACQHRDPPSNGRYIGNKGKKMWFPGDVARFECDHNYVLFGSETSTCGNNYIWNRDLPRCQRGCLRPKDPPRGRVFTDPNGKEKFGVQEWVKFKCDHGYQLHGKSKAICGNNGWTHLPTCLLACPYRAPPENGQYVVGYEKESWKPRDTARFSCLPNYHLVGSDSSTCQTDFRWSSNVPRCERGCDPPNEIPHGAIHNQQPTSHRYRINDAVEYQCQRGYKMRGLGRITCYYHGWSDQPRCDPFCADREPPANGGYKNGQKSDWFMGDKAEFMCYDGYKLAGSHLSVCKSNGQWNNPIPQCRAMESCAFRPPPLNGHYVEENPNVYYSGQFATFGCDSNYVLEGSAKSRCKNDGKWSHSVPTCRYVTPVASSCKNNCGQINVLGGCACDNWCTHQNDCCSDYKDTCSRLHVLG